MKQNHQIQLRDWLRQTGWTKRRLYDEVGAVADEIIANCFGNESDRRIWAARMFEYPWALWQFHDHAYLCASQYRVGELKNPVTAFQNWINHNFPSGRKETNK